MNWKCSKFIRCMADYSLTTYGALLDCDFFPFYLNDLQSFKDSTRFHQDGAHFHCNYSFFFTLQFIIITIIITIISQ